MTDRRKMPKTCLGFKLTITAHLKLSESFILQDFLDKVCSDYSG